MKITKGHPLSAMKLHGVKRADAGKKATDQPTFILMPCFLYKLYLEYGNSCFIQNPVFIRFAIVHNNKLTVKT